MIEQIEIGAVVWGVMVFGLLLSVFTVLIGVAVLIISLMKGFGLLSIVLGLLFVAGGAGAFVTLYMWFTRGV